MTEPRRTIATHRLTSIAAALAALAACSGGGSSSGGTPAHPATSVASATPAAAATATSAATTPASAATPAVAATPTALATPAAANAALRLPPGFGMSVVAAVDGARELAALPNGDLLVGTSGAGLVLVPNADGPGVAGSPVPFATLGETAPEGVAAANGALYATTQHELWRTPYATGDRAARGFVAIATYRQGPIAPNSDGDVHTSASVAVTATHVYVGIGSSCNACVESDPTRSTIQMANLDGTGMTTRATRYRNAIALAIDPQGHLWAGGAGQDGLPSTHPYEFFDDVGSHPGIADYGWPDCEEDRVAYVAGSDCRGTVAPLAELPAYSTIIGAAFYPTAPGGAYAFPAAYRGGAFVTAHGSWHVVAGHHLPPRVVFFPMTGSMPQKAVDWSDPTAQWSEFVGGWQDDANGDARVGRPTGVAVGPNGSLFVADDQTGAIYRIRPLTSASASRSRR